MHFAPDPSTEGVGQRNIGPLYREARPLLEYRLRDKPGRPITKNGDVASSELPIVRAHLECRKRGFSDRPVAHVVSHFSMAHGAGTTLATSAFDSSPARTMEWSYVDTCLHRPYAHLLDVKLVGRLLALGKFEEMKLLLATGKIAEQEELEMEKWLETYVSKECQEFFDMTKEPEKIQRKDSCGSRCGQAFAHHERRKCIYGEEHRARSIQYRSVQIWTEFCIWL